MNAETIHHIGYVERIEADRCLVRILQTSACGECSVRHLCKSSESKEKLIEVRCSTLGYEVGQEVVLEGTLQQGLKAVYVAYLVPLLLMLAVLLVCAHFFDETLTFILIVLVLAIYYGALYLIRNKLGNLFGFRIIESNRKM